MADNRTASYADFVPNRFRRFVPPPIAPIATGVVIITSTGSYEIGPDGEHIPRPRRAWSGN